MRIFSNYRCFENSKHVLTLKVERFEDFCLALTAEKGKDLGSIIGDRLCEESKTFVEINLSRKYGNPTANLLPRQSPPSSEREFFNFLQRNLHEDTPLEYEYHLTNINLSIPELLSCSEQKQIETTKLSPQGSSF